MSRRVLPCRCLCGNTRPVNCTIANNKATCFDFKYPRPKGGLRHLVLSSRVVYYLIQHPETFCREVRGGGGLKLHGVNPFASNISA